MGLSALVLARCWLFPCGHMTCLSTWKWRAFALSPHGSQQQPAVGPYVLNSTACVHLLNTALRISNGHCDFVNCQKYYCCKIVKAMWQAVKRSVPNQVISGEVLCCETGTIYLNLVLEVVHLCQKTLTSGHKAYTHTHQPAPPVKQRPSEKMCVRSGVQEPKEKIVNCQTVQINIALFVGYIKGTHPNKRYGIE